MPAEALETIVIVRWDSRIVFPTDVILILAIVVSKHFIYKQLNYYTCVFAPSGTSVPDPEAKTHPGSPKTGVHTLAFTKVYKLYK